MSRPRPPLFHHNIVTNNYCTLVVGVADALSTSKKEGGACTVFSVENGMLAHLCNTLYVEEVGGAGSSLHTSIL